jgi:acyl-CoA synthetase (AMP-forming)/AMP-acid ligase II
MQDWYNALDHSMPELIRRAAADYGDAPFVVDEGGQILSFRGLERAVEAAARGLLGLGIAPGDRVAIWAPNGSGWIVAACAIELIGGVMVPINTRFKGAEAGYILGKIRAKALVTVASFLGTDPVAMLQAAMGGRGTERPVADLPALAAILMLDDEPAHDDALDWADCIARGASAAALDAARTTVTPATVCDILFTSGTTGHPKGAMHAHGQALWMVGIWNRSNDLRRGDRMLIVNPFFHSFGYRSGWVSALLAGITVYPCAVFDVDRVLASIERERISVLMGPPTLFTAILDHPERARFDLSSLRVGHTGSSNVPVVLIRRAREELGFDLFLTSYGLTESTALVSVCYPEDSFETIARTVGHALPGTELRIADPDGKPLPQGESGELLVRGPNVMQGYFEDAAATAAAIDAEGWLHTGDVGAIGPDGTLRILDRLKDIVIVGGFNAYPAEIEHVLIAHPAIAEAAIITVPDERMGEVCGACIVLRAGAALTLADLTAWARERLANYKVPRHLFLFESFPRTPLGKIQKFALKQEALAQHDASHRKDIPA